jgi:hypothetical protein
MAPVRTAKERGHVLRDSARVADFGCRAGTSMVSNLGGIMADVGNSSGSVVGGPARWGITV